MNKGNKRTNISETDIRRTLVMAQYGMPALLIASLQDRSTASIYRILTRFGIAANGSERTPQQHTAAAALFEAGGLDAYNNPAPYGPGILPGAPVLETSTDVVPHGMGWLKRLRLLFGVEADQNLPPRGRPEGVVGTAAVSRDDPPMARTSGGVDELERVPVDEDNVEYVCKDCGADFQLSVAHIDWFISRDFPVPKRCSDCRARRRGEHDEGGAQGSTSGELDELDNLKMRISELEAGQRNFARRQRARHRGILGAPLPSEDSDPL